MVQMSIQDKHCTSQYPKAETFKIVSTNKYSVLNSKLVHKQVLSVKYAMHSENKDIILIIIQEMHDTTINRFWACKNDTFIKADSMLKSCQV